MLGFASLLEKPGQVAELTQDGGKDHMVPSHSIAKLSKTLATGCSVLAAPRWELAVLHENLPFLSPLTTLHSWPGLLPTKAL